MKDFLLRFQSLKDELHREIIKQVILKTKDEGEDFDLELKTPFYTWVNDWDNNYKVQIAVTGITGTSNELITRCITDGEISQNMDYQDLTFQELDFLYKQIVTDSFTINVY
jgi:hypothetical protein